MCSTCTPAARSRPAAPAAARFSALAPPDPPVPPPDPPPDRDPDPAGVPQPGTGLTGEDVPGQQRADPVRQAGPRVRLVHDDRHAAAPCRPVTGSRDIATA